MKRKRGFTLIEIMVVVTILVILMSIVFRLSNLLVGIPGRPAAV